MSLEPTRHAVADSFARRFAPPELYDPKKRREWRLGRNDEDRGPYVVELNLQHIEGLSGAVAALETRLRMINSDAPPPVPEHISKTYSRCLLTVAEWQKLLVLDGEIAESLAREASEEMAATSENRRRVDSMRFRA